MTDAGDRGYSSEHPVEEWGAILIGPMPLEGGPCERPDKRVADWAWISIANRYPVGSLYTLLIISYMFTEAFTKHSLNKLSLEY